MIHRGLPRDGKNIGKFAIYQHADNNAIFYYYRITGISTENTDFYTCDEINLDSVTEAREISDLKIRAATTAPKGSFSYIADTLEDLKLLVKTLDAFEYSIATLRAFFRNLGSCQSDMKTVTSTFIDPVIETLNKLKSVQ